MFNKVLKYIEKGKSEGAKLETGGNRIGNTGYYIEPTVFSNVQDSMSIAQDEVWVAPGRYGVFALMNKSQ